MNNITAIVLASGLSRRMGVNKLMLDIEGRPLITCVLDALEAIDLQNVLVVTAYETIHKIASDYGYDSVFNASPEMGQSHSIVLGVSASPDSEGWLFLNGDMPNLRTETIFGVLDTAQRKKDKIIVPRYDGMPGQPVYFPGSFYRDLIDLKGDCGGRQIIRKYPERVFYIDIMDSLQGTDIDTVEDYEKYQNIRGRRKH